MMAFASRFTQDIYTLAETYGLHMGRGVEAVSGFVVGNGNFFRRLPSGADCRTATLEQVHLWFDRNWPIDLPWPNGVMRSFNPANSGFLASAGTTFSQEEAEFLARISHLPIWLNGRRPAWWHDMEIRAFVTRSHRQMSTLLCAEKGAAKFGSRFPKKSAIHEYWQRLDSIASATPIPPRPRPPKPKKEAA